MWKKRNVVCGVSTDSNNIYISLYANGSYFIKKKLAAHSLIRNQGGIINLIMVVLKHACSQANNR